MALLIVIEVRLYHYLIQGYAVVSRKRKIMGYSLIMHLEPLPKEWCKHLLLGFLFMLLGIWRFITSLASYRLLSLFFTLAFVTTGAFAIISAVPQERGTKCCGWHLLGGILAILIAAILQFNLVMTMTLLPGDPHHFKVRHDHYHVSR